MVLIRRVLVAVVGQLKCEYNEFGVDHKLGDSALYSSHWQDHVADCDREVREVLSARGISVKQIVSPDVYHSMLSLLESYMENDILQNPQAQEVLHEQ